MTTPNAEVPRDTPQKGLLGAVERIGNLLPDPVMIFVWLIAGLMVLSAFAAAMGWQASLAYSGDKAPPFADLENGRLTFTAQSLFSEENIERLLTEMPRTLAGFAPLGQVLVIIFGAAVAERVGLLSALIRVSLRDAPRVIAVSAKRGSVACTADKVNASKTGMAIKAWPAIMPACENK